MTAARERVTLDLFAEKTGCHATMASRLRTGKRKPSLSLLLRIGDAFKLPEADLIKAYRGGAESFGAYLRKYVFRDDEQTPAA